MLEFQTFKKGMDRLGSYYDKPLGTTRLDEWFGFFENEEPEVFENAVSNCLQNERYFPTPNDFRKHVETARRYYQNHEKAHERWQSRQVVRPKKSDSAFVKASKELLSLQMQAMKMGKPMQGDELAEKMFEIAKKYPGNGMENEARKVLDAWYKRQGLKTPDCQKPDEGKKMQTCPQSMLCFIGDCNRVGVWSPSVNAEKGPWYCREHAK